MKIKKIEQTHQADVDALVAMAFQPYQAIYQIKANNKTSSFSFETVGLFSEQQLLGVVSYYENAGRLHLLKIAVHPKEQGKGYFSVLLDHMEEVARHKGLTELALYTVKQTDAYVYFTQKQFMIVAESAVTFAEPVLAGSTLIEYEMHKSVVGAMC